MIERPRRCHRIVKPADVEGAALRVDRDLPAVAPRVDGGHAEVGRGPAARTASSPSSPAAALAGGALVLAGHALATLASGAGAKLAITVRVDCVGCTGGARAPAAPIGAGAAVATASSAAVTLLAVMILIIIIVIAVALFTCVLLLLVLLFVLIVILIAGVGVDRSAAGCSRTARVARSRGRRLLLPLRCC